MEQILINLIVGKASPNFDLGTGTTRQF